MEEEQRNKLANLYTDGRAAHLVGMPYEPDHLDQFTPEYYAWKDGWLSSMIYNLQGKM